MAKKKRKVGITIDPEIWDEAGLKIPNRSEFIEDQFRIYLGIDNTEERELISLIEDKNAELSVLEGKLCKLREKRLGGIDDLDSDLDLFSAPMVSLGRLHEGMGFVGKNQIKRFAKKHDVPYDALLEHVVNEGFVVKEFGEVPK